jgi:exonuclease III
VLANADEEHKEAVCAKMIAWLCDRIKPDMFVRLAKHFLKFLRFCPASIKDKFVPAARSALFLRLGDENFVLDDNCWRLLRLAVEKIVKDEQEANIFNFQEQWANFLSARQERISLLKVAAVIQGCVRRSRGAERAKWEKFQADYVGGVGCSTKTSAQTCAITVRGVSPQGKRAGFPKGIVIWNGNGIAARWGKLDGELTQIVDATNPDLLCFLEAKTNSDKLLMLEGFDAWAEQKGFQSVSCYWSANEDRSLRGCEGIVVFTKMPCSVVYGMGDPELDMQARVVTLEFERVFVLITYHPYGGFSESSLAYRCKWEARFTQFLQGLYSKSVKLHKPVVWGGDLNVNPRRGDWSERAFDPMRKKIPKGTIPPGCRDQDVKAYQQMVAAIDGHNLARIFNRYERTCFPNEWATIT